LYNLWTAPEPSSAWFVMIRDCGIKLTGLRAPPRDEALAIIVILWNELSCLRIEEIACLFGENIEIARLMVCDYESKKLSWLLSVSVALALLAKPVQAQVVTVNWGAQNSNGLGTSGGAELPIGDLIRIGTFNLTDAQIQQNQFDLNLLNASFIQYGTAVIGEAVDVAAYWSASTTASTDALGINGDKIYYWAFNAPSLGAATEQGIFTSSNPGWVFPSDSGVPNTTTIDLEQVGLSGIVVGGFGNGTSSATGTPQPLYNLTAVPEPSAYAAVFGAICLASVVWSRRSKAHSNLASGASD